MEMGAHSVCSKYPGSELKTHLFDELLVEHLISIDDAVGIPLLR